MKTAPKVDRRLDARIVRSALDEVKAIQTLLADVYKDVGGGRTLLRELVQNADDAQATRLVFVVIQRGWPEAQNSLLRGPALLVANDGPFPVKDWDSLHHAIGGAKAEDVEKVGRFGIGLKSVFHICEAIVYLGAEKGVLRAGALNPWAGTGEHGDADPRHPDWDVVDDDDLRRLSEAAAALFGAFDNGFLQWIPLRRDAHLDRAPDRLYGLGQFRPEPDEVASWFGRSSSLALLLAQCGHLLSIEADRVASPEELPHRRQLARVVRPGFERRSWVGRYEDDGQPGARQFGGRIDAGERVWSVVGVDAVGVDSLRALREQTDWPSDPHWRGGQCVWLPRKALAHAAITVVLPNGQPAQYCGAHLRWAVFLPLDDDPSPKTNAVVETVDSRPEGHSWDIIMHGYFWPSHDRRSIPGVTDDDAGTGDAAVRTRWNRAVRDDLLLPLLPSALANAVKSVPDIIARALLEGVAGSRTVKAHVEAVTRRDALLPVLTKDGVVWEAHRVGAVTILSVPSWMQAPPVVQQAFIGRTTAAGIVFIDANAPRIGGEPGAWPLDQFERILSCISAEVLRTREGLAWAELLQRHVFQAPEDRNHERAAAAARWLAARISEGVLTTATAHTSGDAEEDSRAPLRRLFETLPAAWLVNAPVASQQAVVELAKNGAVGPGLVPIPLGRRPDKDRGLRPDRQHLDRALLELGTALSEKDGTPQGTQQSRLLLAETLLSVREDLQFDERLRHLPLLRARRLPDDRDEPWSIDELRTRAPRYRVFSRVVADDGKGDGSLDAPSDPKRAVKELAEAIGEPVWLVDASVGVATKVPTPTADALSLAVLQSGKIQSPPTDRVELLQRLAKDAASAGPQVRSSICVLLTGRLSGPEVDVALFYVRSQDSEESSNRRTLETLLRLLGRSWCAVDARLIEPLPHGLVRDLGAKAVDGGVLQGLLRDCLHKNVDWHSLHREEVLHLLARLHGNSAEALGDWRAMPLHRDHQGGRGPIDERTWRVAGQLRPPRELETEVRLLEPDPEVATLYVHVPVLNDEGILQAMLESRHPQQFADRIVHGLRSEEGGPTVLPRDPKLRDLLQETAWLPCRDGTSGVAPGKLIVLPGELRACVAPFVAAGCLGDYRIATDVSPGMWESAEDVVHELLGRPDVARQVNCLASAINSTNVSEVDGGAYFVLPAATRIDPLLIDDALQSPIVDAHRGWALLRAAATVLAISGRQLDEVSAPARDALVSLARSLCGPIPAAHQIETLKTIAATRPAKDSRTGRLFHVLVEVFSQGSRFFEDVLPHIVLPTQDGQWRESREIAKSESGIARRHRVLSDLRSCLRLDTDEPVHQESGTVTKKADVVDTAGALAQYFKPWAGKVPSGAVATFLSLLGKGKNGAIVKLVQQWLGEDVSVEGMFQELFGAAERASGVRVFYSGRVARGNRAEVLNLLGEWVEMDAAGDSETIFAADPQSLDHWRGDFWNPQLGDIEPDSAREAHCRSFLQFWSLNLRDVEPDRRTGHELISLLGATVEWWAVRILRIEQKAIRQWWARWGAGSQAQVGPVRASILAHLPLTLRQLDVNDSVPLRDALRNAERAQRRREQAPPSQTGEAIAAERSALDRLGDLICRDPEHQSFLWRRVQELIRRFGYREDSVLLELAQNADDALAQATEIARGPLPASARRLLIRVHQRGGVPTVDVVHYGRPINDTGGASFPEGRDRQWDQDLYFMMLLNLSSKQGEAPAQASASSTTGRFGLGFKSVHLVSTSPSVVSGFLAFSIAGGLLPEEHSVPDDPDLVPVEGHRATRVRLPLRGDVTASDLIESLFCRFAYTRALLPAFARQVHEVLVDGGPHAGVSVFDGEPVEDAPGWYIAKATVELPGHGQWRIIRFRPADAGKATGTTALIVGLRDGLPSALPQDLPFLWNVTPTSEDWGCGYAVNGPFKLDPGRAHVSLDDEATLRVVNLLGEALGEGLVALHDALLSAGEKPAGVMKPPSTFLAALWRVLTSGLDSPDELRRGILLRLHRSGRGLSAWMGDRAVVPSGLPAPFPETLPPLQPGMRLDVAAGGLDDPSLCRTLAEIGDVVSVIQGHRVVSAEVEQRLRPLLSAPLRRLQPTHILAELVERWDHVLTPERLHALRPLAEDRAWQVLQDEPHGVLWHSRLVARATSGAFAPLRELLLPREGVDQGGADADVEDELLRAAFAPDSHTLDPEYICQSEDLTIFLRLRLRHQIDSAMIAGWYANLTPDRRPAALMYLLHGKLQHEVLQRLVPLETRPPWLREYDEVHNVLRELGDVEWQCQALLAALFPDRFRAAVEPVTEPVLPESVKRSFFQRLEEWWNDVGVRRDVIASYEAQAWPDWLRRDGIADGLREGSRDHWLALLVLGACQSLGRTQEGQHRSFIELAHREGWWEVFKASDDTVPWMDVLRTWQDRAIAELVYARWMSLFPSVYQLSRYLETYRRLLTTAGRRSADLFRVTCLLAPRVDEALTGAGQQFDAPPAPLNMGLHWVLRELVRLGIVDGEHVFPDCWIPSEQVLGFLRPLGLLPASDGASNSEKARMVFEFLASEFHTPTPHLHRAFDIPLRHVNESKKLREELGLEGP